MNTKSKGTAKLGPYSASTKPLPATKSSSTHESHPYATQETIHFRATSVTTVLERIMSRDSGYRHSGLNE